VSIEINKTLELKKFNELLRAELLARRGKWQALVALSKGRLTYRWLVAFAGKEYETTNAEALFELARVMGFRAQVWLYTETNGLEAPGSVESRVVAASPSR